MENKLEVNTSKIKFMICKKSNRNIKTRKLLYKGTEIERAKEYTYLGIPFTQTGTFTRATYHAISKAKIALGTIWRLLIISRSNGWEAAEKLFDLIVGATLLYNSGIWGSNHTKTIKRTQTDFLKKK